MSLWSGIAVYAALSFAFMFSAAGASGLLCKWSGSARPVLWLLLALLFILAISPGLRGWMAFDGAIPWDSFSYHRARPYCFALANMVGASLGMACGLILGDWSKFRMAKLWR
jgi:hypothetical protein